MCPILNVWTREETIIGIDTYHMATIISKKSRRLGNLREVALLASRKLGRSVHDALESGPANSRAGPICIHPTSPIPCFRSHAGASP